MELLHKKILTDMWTAQEIISGNSLKVKPTWSWGGATGDTVVITSYSVSSQSLPAEIANTVAVNRLKSLLTNVNGTAPIIVLATPTRTENGKIFCDVLLNGVSISTYFPDFKK